VRFLLPPDRGAVRGSARAAVLAEWMSEWLGRRVAVEVQGSYRDLAVEIEGGRADLAWAPPAVCARIRTGARTLLTAVRDGRSDYVAAIVVRRADPIRGLEDLRGRRASWVDPLSTSGHLLAIAYLASCGLEPTHLLAEQRFAGSFRDALMDVVEHRADVTSIYMVADDERRTMAELRELIGPEATKLRIASKTDPAPFDALVVGVDAPADLEDRLLSLERIRGPLAMLLEICRADRFERAADDAYAPFERFVEDLLG